MELSFVLIKIIYELLTNDNFVASEFKHLQHFCNLKLINSAFSVDITFQSIFLFLGRSS